MCAVGGRLRGSDDTDMHILGEFGKVDVEVQTSDPAATIILQAVEYLVQSV